MVKVLNARMKVESSLGSMTGDFGVRSIYGDDFRPNDGEEVEIESHGS